jgi:hypothetical protein
VTDKKLQIKLRDYVEVENDIIQLIERSGPRSGLSKQLLIAGYNALYNGSIVNPNTTNDKPEIAKPEKHNFSSIVSKG